MQPDTLLREGIYTLIPHSCKPLQSLSRLYIDDLGLPLRLLHMAIQDKSIGSVCVLNYIYIAYNGANLSTGDG